MKVLLRRVTSGLYYKTEKDWTEHVEQARDFISLEEAIQAVRTAKLADMEAVISVAGGKYEVLMKID